MTDSLQQKVDLRKCKRELYLSLLHNIKFLSPQERKILQHMSGDKDILLLLQNGTMFEVTPKQMSMKGTR